MVKFSIGLAILWLIITIRGKSFKITGIPSLALAGAICYGLGALVMLLFGR